MALTANFINFVNELVYGDMGTAELGAPPAGTKNHIHWTRDNLPYTASNAALPGNQFLAHHLDYMLARYEAWRSKFFLPPVRPWDGTLAFPPAPDNPPVPMPASLNGSPFPAVWTEVDLGNAVRAYYNQLRDYMSFSSGGLEMAEEIKAPFSYRYWAFMKWASDLRKRLLGQPVVHVHEVYDRDGTVLSEKDFTDIFHQVHHVWHPNNNPLGQWTTPTPFFKTSVGQHIGKKEISRTQVGAEFFTFHRDHLELFDRWLSRTGHDPMQSINTCAHDTAGAPPVPPGTDAENTGYPKITNWATNPPTVDFNPVHTSYWNGDLHEMGNLGEMGQYFATDNNQFGFINIPGASHSGYHADGHILNSDLYWAVANNHSVRFYAWHHFNDDIWKKREPRFQQFIPVDAGGLAYPEPVVLTILREFSTSTNSVEPSTAIAGIDLATGHGTVRALINVRPDLPFNRTFDLVLRCDVLREVGGTTPVLSLTRNLEIIPAGAPGPAQRLQNTNFIEDFVFDGSAGTLDGDGDGPFKADNLAFPTPTAAGFKNSRIKITGYLTCRQRPDGSIPAVSGTLSSAGTAVTGSGTSFNTQLRQGDLIRANGQVRMVALINSNTSLTLLEAFSPNLPAGTGFERLDGFDHESVIEIPLIQEKQAPEVTAYLDRSTFSLDQVNAVVAGSTSVFDDSFYVVLQDRTSRPLNIVWPPDVEPALHGLIAPPVYAAGLYANLAHAPLVELRDVGTNNLIPGVSVAVTAAQPESPSLHPGIPQRITYPCQVTFTQVGPNWPAFAGLVSPGDFLDVKLVVTARDRSGNEVVDDSKRVRLQYNANPYMLDGPTSWLSVDARVFQIREGQSYFGVPAGWTNPNTFIKDVIDNLRAGNGTAGSESFDNLPTDQGSAVLEYSTTVGGQNVYNFALSKVRLQSQSGLSDVRATFRLFRWGTANVEFNDTLAYRSAPSGMVGVPGVGLLGRTAINELASIPFFAEPRVAVGVDMNTQNDPKNIEPFGPTGGTEAWLFYGAYLDINQPTPRFPSTYVNDTPAGGGLLSIRDLLVDHHQCMVVELAAPGDATIPGATPGTSDNLAQRNLLIVRTANPGDELTRTVQHAFNIDLTRNLQHWKLQDHQDDHNGHGHPDNAEHAHRHGGQPHEPDRSTGAFLAGNCCEKIEVLPAQPRFPLGCGHHAQTHDHLESGWLAQFPDKLKAEQERLHLAMEKQARWTFDAVEWKPGTGLDELAIFWNNLPKDSEVTLFLPGANVEQIFNFRNLRHAPPTVQIVDSQTLRLFPEGTTYLPIPAFWGDNLAGMFRIKLPPGIKKGQRFKVDVLQMRSDEARTLGGFQLNIQVEKAHALWEEDRRTLELFHKRLSLIADSDRWKPIVARQVEFQRARAEAMAALNNEENPDQVPVQWTDPTVQQHGRKVRVVLEKIQILDDREPFYKGKGEFRFFAKAYSPDNGGILRETVLPAEGCFKLGDRPGDNEVRLDAVLFEDWVENTLALEIGGVEIDTFDPDDRLAACKRVFTGEPADWLASYAPTGAPVDPQDLGGWKVWYRVENAG